MKIIEQYPFVFADATFEIYWTDERLFLVPLRQLCNALGLNYVGFHQRLQRDPVIVKHLHTVRATVVRSDGSSQEQEVVCVSVRRLHYMMGSLNVDRIKPELRERVIKFKEELADAIYAYFRSRIFSEEIRAELDAMLPPDQQEFHQLMDQASAIRAQINEHGNRLTGVEERLTALETRLVGTDYINHVQAKQYLDAVGALGDLLKAVRPQKASPYAVIHATVKRQFEVPSYQLIPEKAFPDVLAFLAAWWKREAPDRPLPKIFSVRQERLL